MDPHPIGHAILRSRFLTDMTWRTRAKIIVWVLPVLFAIATLGFLAENALYVLRSERVEGTVVQRYEWPGETVFDRGTINYEPIFTYRMDGEDYRASVGSSHSSFDVAVGETAMIRAIPGHRGNVRMDTWQGLWFIPAMLSLFLAASVAIALPLWLIVDRLFFRKARA
ncbi:hypothetical protein [Wenxinia marina]|uniref:DUF3592 domain-containing protein n=1 Tax=Wenxinia marina DSM 24838 TaxID=1123501 RepID=A0A0D0Q2N2_9RHOB|nr:hypothetical protein [Wenxinia marina]KIQ68794.1 hypothetical protein Wenmar_02521 [Wenxinia marina DSM 24838]GGL65157.1 hypothetical protein GCM10011392_19780 [Wenxinia marina]